MADADVRDPSAIADRLFRQANAGRIRITAHAHQEMVEEEVRLDDVVSVLQKATLVENYPEHKRGPCCLVCGQSQNGRHLHVVCTTSVALAIVITVYEPKPPKWATPFTRGHTQ